VLLQKRQQRQKSIPIKNLQTIGDGGGLDLGMLNQETADDGSRSAGQPANPSQRQQLEWTAQGHLVEYLLPDALLLAR
jgi:hypothetical protein